MKTILYNPIFINPQAYYVFPQLYDIEKGDSFIEPTVYSGYLLIEDLTSNTSSQVTDTREVDFTQFASKRIRISQYTNIGAVVLGEWLLPEGDNVEDPAWYTEALICEYNPIRQGCTNQNMNTDNVLRDLSGNGYHMYCYNFAWNAQSGIYDDGSLILDGVDDYLKVTGLPIMDDFTVMVQSYDYTSSPSVLASKAYPTAEDGAFILRNVDTAGRGSLRSFGNNNWVTYIQETVNVMAMTKTECYKDFDNNVNFYVTPGTGVDSDTLWIGKIRDNNSVFGKTRLYSFLMFNRSLTKEEMDWVRNNKMNK